MQAEISTAGPLSRRPLLRLLIQLTKRKADGAQVTKRVTKPMIASGERPIWMDANGLSSVKEQDWY